MTPPDGPSDEQLDAALAAINAPGRLDDAQRLVTRLAPGLHRVLASAMAEGGWFGSAHDQVVGEAITGEDPMRAVKILLAEETRLGMLVGVAIGFELFREIGESAGGELGPLTPNQED